MLVILSNADIFDVVGQGFQISNAIGLILFVKEGTRQK